MSNRMFAIVVLTFLASGSVQAAPATTTGKGSLDKELIRQVIQKHIGEVKQCYEAQLQQNKRLTGRVMTHFTIGEDGKVTDSSITETTLKSPACEKCIADAVRSWEFPKPRGGQVEVSYPFLLTP